MYIVCRLDQDVIWAALWPRFLLICFGCNHPNVDVHVDIIVNDEGVVAVE